MIVVFTGDGKGKTSAAVGTAFRAWGQGKRVLVIAFLKASNISGEFKAVSSLKNDRMKIFSFGRNCPYDNQDCCPGSHECIVTHTNKNDADENIVLEGLDLLSKELRSGKWDVIVLDELLNVYNLFPNLKSTIMNELINYPSSIDLIITGREGSQDIIDVADYVTEMKMIKHPFLLGITARKGIDY